MARYALVIGVAAYNNFGNLEKAVTDAEAIAQLLERQGNFQEVKRLPAKWLKDESRWVVAPDKKLTGKELGNVLRSFLLEQAAKNEAVIYFAGHGFPASSCMGVEQGYLATSDCSEDGRNAIPLRDFNTLMVESDLSNLVVMLDCCYAGTLLERQLLEPTFTAFNTKRDYYLITACRGFQKAYEGVEYGVFTEAILKGLAAENADEKGQVSGDRLFDFVARELKGSGQEPIRMGWGRSLTLVQYQPKKTEIVVDETCPYQGLEAFGKEQARFFFGREKVVQLLMEKLGQANFVPIIGASGSGKSSVVRAGLIPQLEKNGWRVLELILPGAEPLAELKRTLTQLFGRTEVREVYSLIDTDGLRPVIERLSGSERLLLVVDQFEEVFTVCSKEGERRQFIELLTQIAEIPDSRLAIVTTMRADFLEPCLSYESLTRLIQDEAVYMPPLVGAELEEAIAAPAKLQGYCFEEGLLGEILQDVGNEQGCLPLLQFALTELWEKRDQKKHQLTVEQYQAMEGVIGALDRHAEQIYRKQEGKDQERKEQEQEWIKRFFLKLVRTSEGVKDTRKRQTKAKLLTIAEDNPQDRQTISDVLDELIRGRLLVSGQETQQGEAWVDLAHEALMEGWQRFAQWCKETRQLRRLSDRVEDALKEWQEKSYDDSYLMSGGLLSEVHKHWSVLKPSLSFSASKFYKHSEDYWQQQEAALKQAEIAKRDFLANTSLELRTPLNGIIGCLRIVRDGLCDDRDEELDFLQRGDDASIHLLNIINNVLDIAKVATNTPIEAGKLSVELEPIDLHKLLNEVINLQVVPIEHKGIEFHTPDLSDVIAVRVDPAKLKQVLLNVVGNAVKFTDSGSITISTRLEEAGVIEAEAKGSPEANGSQGTRVVVTVQDTGIGIDPTQQHKLFRPFVMVDGSTTRKHRGIGLGLANSQNLLEVMGGSITLFSEGNGLGTTVEISLPTIEPYK